MMYPFLTLDDNTEIVHSECRKDGTVKVYMERPDEKDGFHHATCILPMYRWEDVVGFCQTDIHHLSSVLHLSESKLYSSLIVDRMEGKAL